MKEPEKECQCSDVDPDWLYADPDPVRSRIQSESGSSLNPDPVRIRILGGKEWSKYTIHIPVIEHFQGLLSDGCKDFLLVFFDEGDLHAVQHLQSLVFGKVKSFGYNPKHSKKFKQEQVRK